MKISKPEYIKKAVALSYDEQQRILSRMTGKLPKRLIKEKLSVDEAIAIQLEIEEEQLQEWRKNWDKIRKQPSAKEAKTTDKQVTKTVASKPAAAVKTTKPAAAKTVAVKPATSKPATSKPATTKPTAAKPTTAKPSRTTKAKS